MIPLSADDGYVRMFDFHWRLIPTVPAALLVMAQSEGGDGDDVVLFTGSGTTAAVAKVISALSLDKKQRSFGLKRGSRCACSQLCCEVADVEQHFSRASKHAYHRWFAMNKFGGKQYILEDTKRV